MSAGAGETGDESRLRRWIPAAGCHLIGAGVLLAGLAGIWATFWVGRLFGGDLLPGVLFAGASVMAVLASAAGAVLVGRGLARLSRDAWTVAMIGLPLLTLVHGGAFLVLEPATAGAKVALAGPVLLYAAEWAYLWRHRRRYGVDGGG